MIKIGNDYYDGGDICCGVLMVAGTVLATVFLACITVGIIAFTYNAATGKLANTSTCEIKEEK